MRILLMERGGPLGEPLFSQPLVFFRAALGQPLEIPASRIWVANHNQRHALSRRERQGRLRLEQAFFIAGFNKSHTLKDTIGAIRHLQSRVHPAPPSSTRTVPAPPSMVTLCPLFSVPTSPAIPTMVGMPISRATMAEWERMLPRSMRSPETDG